MSITVPGFKIVRLAPGVSSVISEMKTVSAGSRYVRRLSVASAGAPSKRSTSALVERSGTMPRHDVARTCRARTSKQQQLRLNVRKNFISRPTETMKDVELIQLRDRHPNLANRDDVHSKARH